MFENENEQDLENVNHEEVAEESSYKRDKIFENTYEEIIRTHYR